MAITSSCFEYNHKNKNTPRLISGTLLQSCLDSTPVANAEMMIEYRESFVVKTQNTTTDNYGNFIFRFEAEDWHEGGINGPYYAEIHANGGFLVDGIKPGLTDVGILFNTRLERFIKVYYSINLESLVAGDSVVAKGRVGPFSYFLPSTGFARDTAYCILGNIETIEGQLSYFTSDIKWEIYNSDTLRLWGRQAVKLDNACQQFVETKLILE